MAASSRRSQIPEEEKARISQNEETQKKIKLHQTQINKQDAKGFESDDQSFSDSFEGSPKIRQAPPHPIDTPFIQPDGSNPSNSEQVMDLNDSNLELTQYPQNPLSQARPQTVSNNDRQPFAFRKREDVFAQSNYDASDSTSRSPSSVQEQQRPFTVKSTEVYNLENSKQVPDNMRGNDRRNALANNFTTNASNNATTQRTSSTVNNQIPYNNNNRPQTSNAIGVPRPFTVKQQESDNSELFVINQNPNESFESSARNTQRAFIPQQETRESSRPQTVAPSNQSVMVFDDDDGQIGQNNSQWNNPQQQSFGNPTQQEQQSYFNQSKVVSGSNQANINSNQNDNRRGSNLSSSIPQNAFQIQTSAAVQKNLKNFSIQQQQGESDNPQLII